MAKFCKDDFIPKTQHCPHCGSQNTYAPGPRGEDPIFKRYYGWLVCYGCGEVTEIDYEKKE